MTYHLHHIKFARSLRVRWFAFENNIPLEIHNFDFVSIRGDEYLKSNPTGKIPFFYHEKDNGEKKILTESLAIITYLAKLHNVNINPTEKLEVDQMQLILNTEATIGAYVSDIMMEKVFLPKEKRSEKKLIFTKQKAAKLLNFMEENYFSNRNTKYLLGDHLTLSDYSLAYVIFLLRLAGEKEIVPSKIIDYALTIYKLESWKKASSD